MMLDGMVKNAAWLTFNMREHSASASSQVSLDHEDPLCFGYQGLFIGSSVLLRPRLGPLLESGACFELIFEDLSQRCADGRPHGPI